MKTPTGLAFALAAAVVLLTGCATIPTSSPEERREASLAAIGTWSEPSRLAAAKLMEEYGPPDRIEIGRLVWSARGSWETTAVEDVSYYNADGGADDITQTVPYRVPDDKRGELKAFSGRLTVSKDGARLSARCASEEQNYLTINLAEEIIRGDKDPRRARLFFEDTLALSAAGKASPYMQGLLFPPEP